MDVYRRTQGSDDRVTGAPIVALFGREVLWLTGAPQPLQGTVSLSCNIKTICILIDYKTIITSRDRVVPGIYIPDIVLHSSIICYTPTYCRSLCIVHGVKKACVYMANSSLVWVWYGQGMELFKWGGSKELLFHPPLSLRVKTTLKRGTALHDTSKYILYRVLS